MTKPRKPSEGERTEIGVLAAIYLVTDCSNGVHDFAKLHGSRHKVADRLIRKRMVRCVDGVVECDGDGFIIDPERYGRGYQLTRKGYEVLTAHSPERFPSNQRRFYSLRPKRRKGRAT